jgi:electron transport complex protein RnfC
MKVAKALHRIAGGIHPEYRKAVTADKAVETLPVPKRLLVSLSQHLGAPAKATVRKGDAVAAGQLIGEAAGYVSAKVHSPAAGVVKSVEDRPTLGGRPAVTIEIETDGSDRRDSHLAPLPEWQAVDTRRLVERVTAAGIVGMGGAGFPTAVKLSPPEGKHIDLLILNGAECEPYLTGDHRLMVEHPERVATGADIIRRILGARTVRVGIEENKPDAIRSVEKALAALDGDVEIAVLRTRYPQGAEKQLIYSIDKREVPLGGLPMDVGAVVENVATAAAIVAAVVDGASLTHRIVTVTGEGVRSPANLLAPIGTPLRDLVDRCGGLAATSGKIICGGPMMGIAQPGLETGMTKTTSGLLLQPASDLRCFESMPCISCGRCVAACPMRLLPCTLSECVEAEDYAGAEAYDVLACIECGCCAFECPAHRPLTQLMKQGKAKVTLIRRHREAQAKAAKG